VIPAPAGAHDRDGAATPGVRREPLGTVAATDPARAFVALAAAADPVWLWWSPDGDTLLGAGSAATIAGDDVVTCDVRGDHRFGDTPLDAGTDAGRFAAVEELRRRVDAATDGGPLLWFAASSFTPGATMPAPWQAFRRTTLVAPLLECRWRHGGDWELTANIAEGPRHDTDTDTDTVARLRDAMTGPRPLPGPQPSGTLRRGPEDDEAWRHAVDTALSHIDAGDADKLVLARTLQLHATQPFDVAATLARLRRRQPSSYVYAYATGGHVFCGASPELLVRSDGRDVESLPLAGTTRASVVSGTLTTDPKSRHEHGVLADAVRDALAPYCVSMDTSAEPTERTFGPVTHLATRVRGRLVATVPPTTLLAALHPTPAVGAAPRHATGLLRDIDGVERGLYAGAVGTVHGDVGEFAVALRCAVVHRSDATLYAGAGIVRGSSPAAEFAETGDKLTTMLDALSPH
jgi:isochorismate synthase